MKYRKKERENKMDDGNPTPNLIYYPDERTVLQAIEDDIPLLLLIEMTGSETIICDVDTCFEHNMVLRVMGRKEDIDKYFRVAVDRQGADWTFVCPAGYRGISDKQKRITAFFNDGMSRIREVLDNLNYGEVKIRIPRRYARDAEVNP